MVLASTEFFGRSKKRQPAWIIKLFEKNFVSSQLPPDR